MPPLRKDTHHDHPPFAKLAYRSCLRCRGDRSRGHPRPRRRRSIRLSARIRRRAPRGPSLPLRIVRLRCDSRALEHGRGRLERAGRRTRRRKHQRRRQSHVRRESRELRDRRRRHLRVRGQQRTVAGTVDRFPRRRLCTLAARGPAQRLECGQRRGVRAADSRRHLERHGCRRDRDGHRDRQPSAPPRRGERQRRHMVRGRREDHDDASARAHGGWRAGPYRQQLGRPLRQPRTQRDRPAAADHAAPAGRRPV